MPSNVEAFLMGKGLVFFVELLDCLCRSMSLIRLAIWRYETHNTSYVGAMSTQEQWKISSSGSC